MLSSKELEKMKDIESRLSKLRVFINSNVSPTLDATILWNEYLAEFKDIMGNFSNYMSFVATLLAKPYLITKFGFKNFDAAEKPQGAPGLDIDVVLPDGRRLIAEIKTTNPYNTNDLGAQQKTSFKNDFKKLAVADADIKLFMLTEQSTYELMKKPKYRFQLSGVSVVLLTTGETFSA